GIWFEATWATGGLCFAFAALHLLDSSSTKHGEDVPWDESTSSVERFYLEAPNGYIPARGQRLLALWWPRLAGLASLPNGVVLDFLVDGCVGDAAVIAGAVIVLLVMARQVLALLENDRLARGLLALNENLEARGARRTAQLRALHG